MVLVTGPTGSGKTTTLYSALSELNKISENISTAEDPVEFNLAGINQCQMHEDIGLNFAAALRSFLRQDPDIIMVGEIRDFETAEIAVKAALTGHMVLSTLHTNDAPSTVNRLLNMGIEPFLVASSVNCIVAQRLARSDLPRVRRARPETTPDELVAAGSARRRLDQSARRSRARAAATAARPASRAGSRSTRSWSSPKSSRSSCSTVPPRSSSSARRFAAGCSTLRRSSLNKLAEGTTTLSEVYRVSSAD